MYEKGTRITQPMAMNFGLRVQSCPSAPQQFKIGIFSGEREMRDSGGKEERRMMERGEGVKHWFEEGKMDFVKGGRTRRKVQVFPGKFGSFDVQNRNQIVFLVSLGN